MVMISRYVEGWGSRCVGRQGRCLLCTFSLLGTAGAVKQPKRYLQLPD
jgi:hypothetical protein